jgi:hypothetical protein
VRTGELVLLSCLDRLSVAGCDRRLLRRRLLVVLVLVFVVAGSDAVLQNRIEVGLDVVVVVFVIVVVAGGTGGRGDVVLVVIFFAVEAVVAELAVLVEAVIVEIVLVKSVLVEFILVEFVFFDDFVVGGLRRIIDTRSSCATLWLAKPTVTGATGSPVPGILPESRWPIADGCRRQWGGQAPVWPRRFSSARRSASSRPSVGSAEWSTNVIASATA